MPAFSRRGFVLALAIAGAVAMATAVEAQFGRGFSQVRYATPLDFDGGFQFCRVQFDGRGWAVDWPRADLNVSIRLSELTKTNVSFWPDGEPKALVVRLTDDELFSCPFVMMTEVGDAWFSDLEAARLREYLLKGGFLWADDFWGTAAWDWWVGQLQKALPSHEFPVVTLTPDHPLFRMLARVDEVPQIPSINFWARNGSTSERGADSAIPTASGVYDEHGRMMVLITHNTDLGDSWEREADDPTYFYLFSVPGYAFGINALLYALTY
jgi:hypothetical protein